LSVYIDSGIIVKSYVFETDSPEAVAIIEAAGDPLIFSHVHAVEIPNAIRLKRFRKEITMAQEAVAIRMFRADVDTGRLAKPAYDLAEVFIRAEWLSARYSGNIGTRSLDILHVAAALECHCSGLASFDERQRKIATLAGLTVNPARRRKL
jgi:predicted nucleic acid-binding protein